MSTKKEAYPINPFPPPEPIPCVEAPKGDDGRVGDRYRLAEPFKGGSDWWEISDMVKEYAVVTIQADFPDAEALAQLAFSKVSG